MSYYGNKDKLYEYLDLQDFILYNADDLDAIYEYIKNSETDVLEIVTRNIQINNELGLYFNEYNKVLSISEKLLSELESRNDFNLAEYKNTINELKDR